MRQIKLLVLSNVLFIKVSSRSAEYPTTTIASDIADMVMGNLKFIN